MTRQREFTVGGWGTDHLGPDAVVAFVDDELARRPHERAVAHVENCPDCAAEIGAQRRARTALRTADCPALPSSLLLALRAIPEDSDLPGGPVPDGLAVTAGGDVVAMQFPPASHGRRPGRRMRFGAGFAASGIAIGALAFGGAALPDDLFGGAEEPGVFGGAVLAPAAGAAFGVETVPRTAEDARMLATRTPRTFLRDR